MKRILLVISLAMLAGCGRKEESGLTQKQLHDQLQGYGMASRKMVGDEIKKAVEPLTGHVTTEAGKTRQAVQSSEGAVVANQVQIINLLKGQNVELQLMRERLASPPLPAGFSPPSDLGVSSGPSVAPTTGTISTEASVNGVTVKYSGPGSLEEMVKITREQQERQAKDRRETQERVENDRLTRALINQNAAYRTFEPRVDAVESRVSKLESQLLKALAKIEVDLTKLGTGFENINVRLNTFHLRIEQLAAACNTLVKYAPPEPMPETGVYSCERWWVYHNRRDRCLNVWARGG